MHFDDAVHEAQAEPIAQHRAARFQAKKALQYLAPQMFEPRGE
jgi:hypothetical protein